MKTFWRRLEDVLKMSWRRLEDVLKTFLQDILKTSSKRLEDVFWRRMTKVNIFVLFKTSCRRLLKTKTKDIFKTSSRRLHQDECLLGRNYLTICMTCLSLHKKWSFLLSISSVNVTKYAGNCGLVTFTEEILNGKLHFLCRGYLLTCLLF